MDHTDTTPDSLSDFWDHRLRQVGHTGWRDLGLHLYDQPIRKLAFLRVMDYLGIAIDGNARVLDVGCGIGDFSRLCLERGASVDGVELSKHTLERAQLNLNGFPRFNGILGSIADVDLPEAHYSLVLSITALQHVVEPTAFLRAVQRISDSLINGGVLILLEGVGNDKSEMNGEVYLRRHPMTSWVQAFHTAGLTYIGEFRYPQLWLWISRSLPIGAQPRTGKPMLRNLLLVLWKLFAVCLKYLVSIYDRVLFMPVPAKCRIERLMVFRKVGPYMRVSQSGNLEV